MSTFYCFHVETIGLPPYDDEWYYDFPLELTDDQFDRLCMALRGWIENEGFLNRDAWEDDKDFIRRDLPDIWEQFEEELTERAPVIWDKRIMPYLSQISLFLPKEAYEAVFSQHREDD